MSTQKQRREQLKKDTVNGQKELDGILATRKRAVKGAVTQAAGSKGFATNANVRNKLYSELAGEYKTLNTSINKWTVDSIDDTAKTWWGYAKEDMPNGTAQTFGAFSEKHIQDITSKINPSTITEKVAVNANIGGMLQNDIRTVQAAVSTTLAEGSVAGYTYPQMATIMKAKVIEATGSFTFIDAAGRHRTADSYFAMLNRTLHSTAARDTYNTMQTDAGLDLVRVEGSSSDPDSPCIPWEGKILSLTGETKGYPTIAYAESTGLFHPNCIHTTSVYIPPREKS